MAGLGTRVLPGTKTTPKELLNVVDRPILSYIVEEAREAGIEHIVFVTGRAKQAIEDYFDHQIELEAQLAAKGKTDDKTNTSGPEDDDADYNRAVAAFEKLAAKDRMTFLTWASDLVGAKIAFDL